MCLRGRERERREERDTHTHMHTHTHTHTIDKELIRKYLELERGKEERTNTKNHATTTKSWEQFFLNSKILETNRLIYTNVPFTDTFRR